MTRIPILRLQYSEEDITFIKEEVAHVLRSGYLTMAERVKAFEKAFADYCGVKYAVGTNSGTSALEIILRSIGVEDKTVVMPSNTYMATPLAAIKAGAKVVFTECEKENLQMCPDDLASKIREDTKAVILPASLVINSPNNLRKWLQGFGGQKIVVAETVSGWVMTGLTTEQAAQSARQVAEGEEVRLTLSSPVWRVVQIAAVVVLGLQVLFFLVVLGISFFVG